MQNYFISKLEPLLYVIIGAFVNLAVNLQLLKSTFFEVNDAGLSFLFENASENLNRVLSKIDGLPITPVAVIFLLWLFFGQTLLRIGMHLYRAFKTAETELMVSTAYVHPRNFKQGSYWLGELKAAGGRFVVLALGVVLLIASIGVFIPFASACLRLGLAGSQTTPEMIAYILGSFAVCTLMVAVWAAWFRLFKPPEWLGEG